MKGTTAFMLIFFADMSFNAYFIKMKLQRFAHSYKFTTYASGGKKFFDARFNSKKYNSDTNIQSYEDMQL